MVDPDKRPRKRPKQARAQATFDAIVEATDRLLDTHALDGLTIQAIADRAGVSVGSLYQYFPSKDAIVATVVERDVERVYATMVMMFEASRDLPLEQALTMMVQGIVATYTGRLAFYRTILPEIGRLERDGLIRSVSTEASALILDLMQTHPDRFAVPPAHHEAAAFIVPRTMNLLTHAAIIEQPEMACDAAFVDEVTRLIMGFLLGGPAR